MSQPWPLCAQGHTLQPMEDINAAWAPVKLQLSQSVPFASLAWLGVLCATQQAHTRMPFLRDKGGSVFQLRFFFLGYSLAMRIASEMCTRHSMTTSTLQLSSHQVTGHKFQTKAIVTSGVAEGLLPQPLERLTKTGAQLPTQARGCCHASTKTRGCALPQRATGASHSPEMRPRQRALSAR